MKVLIAFYKANGPHAKWDDKLIAWWTKGPYSHVEIFIPETMERYTSSGRYGGVVKRPIKSLKGYENNDDPVWDYIEVDLPDDAIDRIEEFYQLTKNCKYDWFTIFGFVLPFRDKSNQYVCSEWCSNYLKIMGSKEMWTKNPAKLSPNGLYELYINKE